MVLKDLHEACRFSGTPDIVARARSAPFPCHPYADARPRKLLQTVRCREAARVRHLELCGQAGLIERPVSNTRGAVRWKTSCIAAGSAQVLKIFLQVRQIWRDLHTADDPCRLAPGPQGPDNVFRSSPGRAACWTYPERTAVRIRASSTRLDRVVNPGFKKLRTNTGNGFAQPRPQAPRPDLCAMTELVMCSGCLPWHVEKSPGGPQPHKGGPNQGFTTQFERAVTRLPSCCFLCGRDPKSLQPWKSRARPATGSSSARFRFSVRAARPVPAGVLPGDRR